MSDDLLAREKEFHRVNRELEHKTKELMKEVDSVMNSHNGERIGCKLQQRPSSAFSERDSIRRLPRLVASANSRQNSVNFSKKEWPSQPSNKKELTEENFDDESIIPSIGNQMGGEAVVRFLKAKTKMLQNELQTIQLEYKKKGEYCKELEVENKKLEEAREKWYSKAMSLKDALSTMECANTNLQSKIQTRDIENSALRKEIDGLKKELKTLNQHSNSYDIRLNRSLEDNERLRGALKFSQLEEKELRDHNRKLEDDKRIAIRSLEKQRSELMQAFKKQTLLIDNLKKQKAHLEAGRLMQFTEEEFAKLLDWKLEHF